MSGCNSPTQTSTLTEHQSDTFDQSGTEITPKVTGIGGIFFISEDPEKTRTWYADNLGLEVNELG
jgi:catechol-2,3-dioxygenase